MNEGWILFNAQQLVSKMLNVCLRLYPEVREQESIL